MPRQTGGTGRAPFTSASRSSSQKANRKRKQRGLDAFSIASAENPERNKFKRHRLGEAEQSSEPQKKKQRTGQNDEDEDGNDNSDDDDDEQEIRNSHRKHEDEDGLDISGGSDSEGHEWRMGEVADDDDEDLDSDEAFGESDEERYEGFTFRGSSSNQTKKKKLRASRAGGVGLDLDEDEPVPDGDSDNDSLGEEAVDLATMLDDDDGFVQDSEDEQEDSEESDQQDFDDYGSDEEDDRDDTDKLERLQDLVSALPQRLGDGFDDGEEQTAHDAQSTRLRLLGALRGMANLDPALNRSAKKLADSSLDGRASGKPSALVKVPLPKRQQDRIDREAAYSKAKETLNRWIDTVKHNRRAEHLSFPLIDPHAQEAQGTTRMVAAGGASEPKNELEAAIQTILQESGLASAKGAKGDDENIQEAEELQAKKMPVEEVMARRAELRKQRDLLFREEIRAKRIKKIKSKAYRRVHRKERAKLAEKERDLLAAAGMDDSEAEREQNDRRRAEERMGARHRESKWAKGVKKSGRGAWDDDARAGVIDMARRNEELRKRVEGRKVQTSGDESDDLTSDESDDESDDNGDDGFQLRAALDEDRATDGQESGLSAMKFMQRADAARKRRNDEEVADIQRTLDGGSGDEFENSEPPTTGRRTFGPSVTTIATSLPTIQRNELEEGFESDSDDQDRSELGQVTKAQAHVPPPRTDSNGKVSKPRTQLVRPSKTEVKVAGVEPKAQALQKSDDEADPIRPADLVRQKVKPSDPTGWQTVQVTIPKVKKVGLQHEDMEGLGHDELIPSNQELVKAAFGGDEDEEEFYKEKHAIAVDEDEKTVNNALPGWGSWVGEGMSRTQQKRNKPRKAISKIEGVAAANRKDAKLPRVIVSEKRIKKNAKYLAPTLPHPFESRQQYERSLRVPIGPEWTTKESFQTATKPRVMVKQGIIKPMEAPSI